MYALIRVLFIGYNQMADRRFNLQKVICFEFMGEMRAVGKCCNFVVVSISDDIFVFSSRLLSRRSC